MNEKFVAMFGINFNIYNSVNFLERKYLFREFTSSNYPAFLHLSRILLFNYLMFSELIILSGKFKNLILSFKTYRMTKFFQECESKKSNSHYMPI